MSGIQQHPNPSSIHATVAPVQLPPSSHPHDQHAFTAQFQAAIPLQAERHSAGQWTSISSEDSQEQLAGMSQACDYSTHYLPHL